MKKNIYLLCFVLFSGFLSFGQKTILKGVNYLDYNTGKFISSAAIIIENGKILQTLPVSKLKIGKDDKVIEMNGQWVIPGMIDTHIHLFQSGGLYTRPDIIDLRKYVSYEQERETIKNNVDDMLKRYMISGVTSVVDVGGPFFNFDIRDKYNKDNSTPTIYLTGPLISTYQPAAYKDIEDPPIIKVSSIEEARNLVLKEIPFKPDLIKIWYIDTKDHPAEENFEIVKAIIEESHKAGLPVFVHATQLRVAKLAIKAGCDVLVHSVDEPIDEEFIKLAKDNKIILTPTLLVHRRYSEVFSRTTEFSYHEFICSCPFTLGTLYDLEHLDDTQISERYKQSGLDKLDEIYKEDIVRQQNLKKLYDAGIIIATGTDAGNIGTLHGSSFFPEIEDMQKSGLNNLQIIKSSTIDAAKIIGKDKIIGSIEPGFNADLVILKANPLEDINALNNIEFVVKNGNMIKPDTLIHETPVALAQRQLNAYNSQNIKAFMEPYSQDVELYNFPDDMFGKGLDNINNTYKPFFEASPNLHCQLINRITLGNTVIDRERVTGARANGAVLTAIAIYKIENNKISKVYFVKD